MFVFCVYIFPPPFSSGVDIHSLADTLLLCCLVYLKILGHAINTSQNQNHVVRIPQILLPLPILSALMIYSSLAMCPRALLNLVQLVGLLVSAKINFGLFTVSDGGFENSPWCLTSLFQIIKVTVFFQIAIARRLFFGTTQIRLKYGPTRPMSKHVMD